MRELAEVAGRVRRVAGAAARAAEEHAAVAVARGAQLLDDRVDVGVVEAVEDLAGVVEERAGGDGAPTRVTVAGCRIAVRSQRFGEEVVDGALDGVADA